MKKQMLIALGVCLAAMLGMGTAAAQMTDVIKVTLPYPASLGAVTLPAGQYTLRDLSNDNGLIVVHFYSHGGASVVGLACAISTPDNKAADATKVVLRQEGDRYVVDKIWLGGQNRGYEILSAMHER